MESYLSVTFDKLEKEDQEKAIEFHRYINIEDGFWCDRVEDQVQQVFKLLGITVPDNDISFVDCSSGGNGACFTGTYSFKKDAHDQIERYAPKDEILHDIAKNLQKIQEQNLCKLTATIEHDGSFDDCTMISVHKDGQKVDASISDSICEQILKLMQWVYDRLIEEYDRQRSDAAVISTLCSNPRILRKMFMDE